VFFFFVGAKQFVGGVAQWWKVRELPVLCMTNSWTGGHFVGKLSAMGQPMTPTQPLILPGSINE